MKKTRAGRNTTEWMTTASRTRNDSRGKLMLCVHYTLQGIIYVAAAAHFTTTDSMAPEGLHHVARLERAHIFFLRFFCKPKRLRMHYTAKRMCIKYRAVLRKPAGKTPTKIRQRRKSIGNSLTQPFLYCTYLTSIYMLYILAIRLVWCGVRRRVQIVRR